MLSKHDNCYQNNFFPTLPLYSQSTPRKFRVLISRGKFTIKLETSYLNRKKRRSMNISCFHNFFCSQFNDELIRNSLDWSQSMLFIIKLRVRKRSKSKSINDRNMTQRENWKENVYVHVKIDFNYITLFWFVEVVCVSVPLDQKASLTWIPKQLLRT